jgi:(p)ppGpp synthase/HD superfamily hydrolase
MTLLEQATDFAKNFHKDHTRLTGEPVYEHCQRVVHILQEEGITDEKLLVVATLHHVLKYDNSQELQRKLSMTFGDDLVSLLLAYQSLTLKKVKRHTDFQYNERLMVQTFLNLADNMDVLVIRLADKLANLVASFTLDVEARSRIELNGHFVLVI